MTYTLNSALSKIVSLIALIFSDGHRTRFNSGMSVIDVVFDHDYQIITLKAENNSMVIKLTEILYYP